MTPRHLVPIEPAEAVRALCDDIALELPDRHSIMWLELSAFRETRTPHDARRLASALRHIAAREDLAGRVEGLLS
jgi:hypothetical protein